MGERRPCKAEVVGSNPISSTKPIRDDFWGIAGKGSLLKLWRIVGCAVPSPGESRSKEAWIPVIPSFWFFDN